MTKLLHDQRAAALNLALHSPSLQVGGACAAGTYLVFHWPTFWERHRGFLAPVLRLDPASPWQDVLTTLLLALPGRPLADPHLLDAQPYPREELSVCEAPYDGAYTGLLPDEWTHQAAFAERSHWFAQLLYAVQDLAAVEGPTKTGVWRDATSGRLVINWAVRVEYHPLGDRRHPLPASGVENPLTVPFSVVRDVECKAVVKRTSRRAFDNSLRRSPWPEGHAACTVLSVQDLADQYEWLISRPPPRSIVRYVWQKAFDPQLQEVDDLPLVNLNYFRAWAAKNNIRAFPYDAMWLKARWAIALPVGVFSNRWGDEAASDADRLDRDKYIEQHLTGKKHASVEGWLRDNVITYQGREYYTDAALAAFMVHPEHYFVFEYLRAFLRYVSRPENQSIIADRETRQRRKRRTTDYSKGRAPNWSPEEDAELRLHFGPKTTDDDETERRRVVDKDLWDWLLGPRSKIKECHRTKKQVMGRIFTLNLQLQKECMTRGVMTPSGWKRYCMNRLGQREKRI